MKKRVMVAMSGGVDSSVAAMLLKNKGYSVAGVTMCLGIPQGTSARVRCCGAREIEDARTVCLKLDIPHYVLDFSALLKDKVISNFIEEYNKGMTPNPCVECNRYLKFGALLDKAKKMGFDFLATGHYARLGQHQGRPILKKPRDKIKDQTYFLYAIPQERLSGIIFPLADYTKKEVRRLAKKADLGVAAKPQSQDICFIPGNDYRSFLLSMGVLDVVGDIVDKRGIILGAHKGTSRYTVGQREGLGLSSSEPLYVIAIDATNNRLVVGERKDLLNRGLVAYNINLHVKKLPARAWVKIRYGHRPVKSTVLSDNNFLNVIFDRPQEAVTPGQSAVLYEDDIVLGGGIIKEPILRTGKRGLL